MRALLPILGILCATAGQAGELLVIVSANVPDTSISAEQLASIYSLKKNFWSDRTLIVPVNREASSPERAQFSRETFHLSPQEASEYLDRQRFIGKLPPIVQTSDKAIIAFVRNVPGAVGYINAGPVPSDVKILMHIP
jgi:ABC-type phosphate transport system substrate-binding protein